MSAPASCRGCDTKWIGLRVCHCSACHVTFTGVTTFDMHQVRGRCKHPTRVGLVLSTIATYTETWGTDATAEPDVND